VVFVRGETGAGPVVVKPGYQQPGAQAFDCFKVQRHGAFSAAFAVNGQHAVLAVGLELPDAKPDQFADPAGTVGQNAQDGLAADADGRRRQSAGDSPTVLPFRGTGGTLTNLP